MAYAALALNGRLNRAHKHYEILTKYWSEYV